MLLSHGSGGSRERLVAHVRLLARHGYGVLALDNPGNGESEGHSNGLGDNAQPAIDAAVSWLARLLDVDPERIAGFGSSLGAEVLLQAAAHDPRLRAVIGDGPARPRDAQRAGDPGLPERVVAELGLQAVRGISGMRESPSLLGLVPRIAPRPVLLIAGGEPPQRDPHQPQLPRRRRPSTVERRELPYTGHTAGQRDPPWPNTSGGRPASSTAPSGSRRSHYRHSDASRRRPQVHLAAPAAGWTEPGDRPVPGRARPARARDARSTRATCSRSPAPRRATISSAGSSRSRCSALLPGRIRACAAAGAARWP